MTQPTATAQDAHPSWCSPARCVHDPGFSTDHREEPVRVTTRYGAVSVGLVRLDLLEGGHDVGDVQPSLAVEGDLGDVQLDLDPDDAELLAAALVRAARRSRAGQPAGQLLAEVG